MNKSFHLEECADFGDFMKRIEPLLQSDDKWIFRGQQKAEWVLETRLEREYKRFGVTGTKKDQVERNMIREFRRRLHQYMANVPDENAFDEWMSLMQHHGAPTRLLDCTYSPYVAAYFAFESADSDSKVGIWAVNTDWCVRELKKLNKDLAETYSLYEYSREPRYFKSLFLERRPKKLVVSVTPFRLNERLAYQRGVFLCPGNVRVGFMDNLSHFTGRSELNEKVIEFTVPTGKEGKTRDCALNKLDLMNINRITLFPGLDGFAQSFATRIPSVFMQQGEHPTAH